MQVSLLKELPDQELFRYLSKCFAGRAMEYVSNSVYSVCLLAAQVPRTPHMRVPPGPLWPRLHAHSCSPLGCTRDGRAYAAARGRPSPPIAAHRRARSGRT